MTSSTSLSALPPPGSVPSLSNREASGRVRARLRGVTMADLADDVATATDTLADGPATVVGHAFGNRVARMVATRHPEDVENLTLLACGGLVPPAPEVNAALASVFDVSLNPASHLDAFALAFFVPDNDPSPRVGGWHPDTAGRPRRSNRWHSRRRPVAGGLRRRSRDPTS
jgi:pimeloyl-ACP methyl ester carboxylesterase